MKDQLYYVISMGIIKTASQTYTYRVGIAREQKNRFGDVIDVSETLYGRLKIGDKLLLVKVED